MHDHPVEFYPDPFAGQVEESDDLSETCHTRAEP